MRLRTVLSVAALIALCPAAHSQDASGPTPSPPATVPPAPAAPPQSVSAATSPVVQGGSAQAAESPSAQSAPTQLPAIGARPRIPAVAHTPILVSRFSAAFDSMYSDPGMQRIMAAHDAAGRFAVLNLESRDVRELQTGPVSGIAVDTDDGKVFVAGGGQKVLVFDRKSLVRIDSIDLGGHADAITFDSDDHRLFVDHDGSPDLWIIDAKTHQTVGTIHLDGNPSDLAYDPGAKRVLQTIDSPDRLEQIDPDAGTVLASWPTAPALAPRGVAADSDDHIAFVAGSNGMLVVIDTQSGAVLSSSSIAQGVDQIAFDAVSRQVFCASGAEGVVTVVQIGAGGSSTTLGDIPTSRGAHTLTLAGSGPRLDVSVSYPFTTGSYLQCFSLVR